MFGHEVMLDRDKIAVSVDTGFVSNPIGVERKTLCLTLKDVATVAMLIDPAV